MTFGSCVTACLLHNDPASYRRCGLVKAFRAGALGKPSLNRANCRGGRRETGDLPMSRLKRGLYCVEDRTHLG
jgi:hypothetical protein